MTCVCGKPGDKLCGRCKHISYCSRECQVAHFKEHKKYCKTLGNIHTPATDEDSWRRLSFLPAICRGNPLQCMKMFTLKLPLENIVPMFLCIFSTHFPNVMVQNFTPVVTVLKKNNNFHVITQNCVGLKTKPAYQHFTSFQKFSGNMKHCSDDSMKEVFLMMSFFGKCTQVVMCFGMFIIKFLNTHQMTYGGERVIGWAVQDGTINLNHENVSKIQFIDVKTLDVLPKIAYSLNEGCPLPNEVNKSEVGRNATHVWLTFVTESGRVFELDLSAFQFGTMAPFPCIVPVVNGEPTAFNGICNRHRIFGINMSDFQDTCMELITSHTNMVNSLPGAANNLNVASILERYDQMFSNLCSGLYDMANYANPNYFWDTLKDIDF